MTKPDLVVHSDDGRLPRYWVENQNGEVLFESDDAAETIQWAVDYRGLRKTARNKNERTKE